MDDFKGCNTLVEELTTDVVEIARELELEMKPEDVSELLHSHDKPVMDEEFLLTVVQGKQVVEMESISGEDAVKTLERTAKYLEYYINFVHKTAGGFNRN